MSLSLIEELELQVIALRGNDRAHCASLVQQAVDALKSQPSGVDERAAVYMLKVRGMAWWREADKAAFDSAPDDRYEKLALYDRAALTAPSHGEQVRQMVPEPVRDALARRCLWLAFCWNDHNFGPAHEEARKEALKHGIDSFDAANEWLAAAPSAGSQEKG